MEIKVVFDCANEKKIGLFIPPPGSIGLDLLDIVREELAPVEVSMEALYSLECPTYLGDHRQRYTINLTEEKARQTDLFSGKTEIVVTVPPRSLSKFVDIKVDPYFEKYPVKRKFLGWKWDSRKKRDKLVQVNVKYITKRSCIFDAWAKAGFPLRWDPERVDGVYPETEIEDASTKQLKKTIADIKEFFEYYF